MVKVCQYENTAIFCLLLNSVAMLTCKEFLKVIYIIICRLR